MTQKEYGKRISQMAPPSPIVKDCMFAYVIGGLICVLGQILWNYYGSLGLEKTDASTAASMIYGATYLDEIIISYLRDFTRSKCIFQSFWAAYCINSFSYFTLSLRNRYIVKLPFYSE